VIDWNFPRLHVNYSTEITPREKSMNDNLCERIIATVCRTRPARYCSLTIQRFGLCCACVMAASVVQAITIPQVDDFQDGSRQGWQGAVGDVLMNVGPAGIGDHSLLMTTTGFPGGVNSRLIAYHGGASTPVATQWTGDWSAAGVRRIAFDVLNPNSVPLTIWLGIAGPAGPGGAGNKDAHVTKTSFTVPPDEQWHSLDFRVLADDFVAWGANGSPAAALANVFQFRILHSSTQEWRGALGEASMLIDNVRAIPEPTSAGLLCSALVLLAVGPRRLENRCSRGERR
jgi:hypothetical protein